jgi:predicted HTH transcriptional regulator
MANAEGGIIIFGIAERSGGYPDRVDDGVDRATVSAEQIEQIILSNINPRVEGFFIRRIDLASKRLGRCAFAISIPKAQKNAPHQADKLYYRRHDATTLTMGDNEIRDVIGRSLEFGRKFGIAWDMLVEVRRIVEAVRARLFTKLALVGSGRHGARRECCAARPQLWWATSISITR